MMNSFIFSSIILFAFLRLEDLHEKIVMETMGMSRFLIIIANLDNKSRFK